MNAIAQKLAAAYAIVNKPVPEKDVLKIFAGELLPFTDEEIDVALKRVMRECEWITLKAIIDRIPSAAIQDDGRPEVENAWAMCPKSDDGSVVWTEEMSSAYEGARRLLMEGDPIGARMAFKEGYSAEVARARRESRPVKWTVSLGWDKGDRIRALAEAVEKKRIQGSHALALVGGEQVEEMRMALPESERGPTMLMLEGDTETSVAALARMPGMAQVMRSLIEAKSMQSDPEAAEKSARLLEEVAPKPKAYEGASDKDKAEHRRRNLLYAADVAEKCGKMETAAKLRKQAGEDRVKLAMEAAAKLVSKGKPEKRRRAQDAHSAQSRARRRA